MSAVFDYIKSHTRNDYQRDNFDSFIHKLKFEFKIPVIHIAGTNGKGSVANYIASIYQKQGYKVGLFTSPAVVSLNETIKVSGEPINEGQLQDIVDEYKKLIEKYNLSSFEIETFIALKHFENSSCDLVVLECGMGGETDATNIVDSTVLSIITSVSMEHTDYLGKSLSEIASNKAGIIKWEIPVLIGELDEDSENAIVAIAKERKTSITKISKFAKEILTNIGYKFTYRTYFDMQLQSKAIYSVTDAVIALEAISILNNRFPTNIDNVAAGLLAVKMPGRLDIIHSNPDVVIDGGHNPEAIQRLVNSMENLYQNRNIHIVFACFRDKNISLMLSELGLLSSDIILTSFDHPRCRNKDEYFLYAEDYKYDPDYLSTINNLIATYPNDVILVTGSLAFVGRVINDHNQGLINYDVTAKE